MATTDKLEESKKERKSLVKEYVQAIGIALVLALFIRTFFIQTFNIPSESMLNTLVVGDFLIGTKWDYGVKNPFTDKYIWKSESAPQRGDIIIFKYPKDPKVDYIKRIIGIPGDVIEIRNKKLYRNGEAVKEAFARYSEPETIRAIRDNYGPITVPENKVFVMGDNRDNSYDSRWWGFVEREAIVAKAWRIYWSWESIKNIRWSRIGTSLR